MRSERSEEIDLEMADAELFGEDEVLGFEDEVEDGGELAGILDDLLRDEDEVQRSREEERFLRYAVGDERESKASQFRMRSQDIDEGQMDVPKPEVLNVEDQWMVNSGSVNRLFVIGGGLFLLVVTLGVIWAAIELRHGKEVEAATEKVNDATLAKQQVVVRDAGAMLRSIRETCGGYLAATNLAEKLATVDHPEKVESMMRNYYARHELKPEKLREVEVILSSDSDYHIFWLVECMIEGEQEPKSLVVAQQEDGRFKVVWELDVVYQPMNWDEFREARPTEAIDFRVKVLAKASSGFYGYEFSDYRKYRCFQLSVPGSDDFLWGFTVIGGEADKQLVEAYRQLSDMGAESEGFPLILSLKYMKDSQSSKCVLIERFVDKNWKVN